MPDPLALGLFGTGTRAADARRGSLERLGYRLAWMCGGMDDGLDWDVYGAPPLDALFVAGSTAERAFAVRTALRHGVPVLAEWPPAASRREFEALVALADEAGVGLSVARTVRFHDALRDAPHDARIAVLRRTVAPGRSPVAALPEVLDVAARLVGGFAVRRVDAAKVQGPDAAPRAIGASVRFAHGALALVDVAVAGGAPGFTVEAHRTGDTFCTALADGPEALDRETAAFLERLGTGHPDASALPLLRLVERVAARLR